jgi:hypothetical protein
VVLALSRKRIAQHLQYSLACLAPMEELQTGCSRGVVGCDDALRVATESQLQESPCRFTNTAVWSDEQNGNTDIRKCVLVECKVDAALSNVGRGALIRNQSAKCCST